MSVLPISAKQYEKEINNNNSDIQHGEVSGQMSDFFNF